MLNCETSFSKRLSFSFLNEIASEFGDRFIQSDIDQVSRPFAFIKYDNYIQRVKRKYDKKSSSTMSNDESNPYDTLNNELSDVSSILRQNINDVLDRGQHLNSIFSFPTHIFLRYHAQISICYGQDQSLSGFCSRA